MTDADWAELEQKWPAAMAWMRERELRHEFDKLTDEENYNFGPEGRKVWRKYRLADLRHSLAPTKQTLDLLDDARNAYWTYCENLDT